MSERAESLNLTGQKGEKDTESTGCCGFGNINAAKGLCMVSSLQGHSISLAKNVGIGTLADSSGGFFSPLTSTTVWNGKRPDNWIKCISYISTNLLGLRRGGVSWRGRRGTLC